MLINMLINNIKFSQEQLGRSCTSHLATWCIFAQVRLQEMQTMTAVLDKAPPQQHSLVCMLLNSLHITKRCCCRTPCCIDTAPLHPIWLWSTEAHTLHTAVSDVTEHVTSVEVTDFCATCLTSCIHTCQHVYPPFLYTFNPCQQSEM